MKTAVVTGANGFIGSHLVFRLLSHDWEVHAVGRRTSTATWQDRVLSALQETGDPAVVPGKLEFHEIDLNLPVPALKAAFAAASFSADAVFIHVAGDTHFKPVDPAAQHRVNVQIPANLVLALDARIARMLHVSTAYVAGGRTGLIRETELNCGQQFWNPYELSKFDAETGLTALCAQQHLPLTIVRPSIIVNDRESGRASTFTHLNALVEIVSRLQDYYGLSDGQLVSKTIRLIADPDARPNLAPIDSIVPALVRIAECPSAAGQTFHLCHPHPQTNREVLNLIAEAYGVRDRLTLEFVDHIAAPVTHTEEMAARSLKVYAPYLNNRLDFDVTNSRRIVPDYDSLFSPIEVAYIHKVVDYQRHHRKHKVA